MHALAILALTACGGNTSRGPAEDLPHMDAATLAASAALREQALAFFQPMPDKVDHPGHPDSPEMVELGRKLFMDPRLSLDSSISCNSCHQLDRGGGDTGPTSTGVRGQKGGRNSPTVYNAALHNMQFWDGRATDVEEQAGMPVMNPIEMAIPTEAFLVKRLKGTRDLPALFKAAYPNDVDPITYANIRGSIGAFERTLLTPSRFDDFLKGNDTALDSSERAGLRTFMDVGCTACHNGAAVGGASLQKFGVHKDYRALTGSPPGDEGRKEVTHKGQDKDVFKVSGLRNITQTAPYFHDGRVARLDSAIRIMSEAQLGRELTEREVQDILAFLEALTGRPPIFVQREGQ